MTRRFIVIGGVAAGTSAASRARRTDPQMEIVLFEKGDYVSYGACDEPYYISGLIPSWENLLVRKPEVFKQKQNIDIRLRHEVTKIDPGKQTVEVLDLDSGDKTVHEWDALIIATGARPKKPALQSCEASNVFYLKSLNSAISLKRFLDQEKPENVVTYGGGFIALEMAGAFAELGIANTVVIRGKQVGGRLEPEIAEKVEETLNAYSGPLVKNAALEEIELDDAGRAKALVTDKGRFEAQAFLISIGVVPNVELAQAAGIELGPTGAIAVDSRQQTSIKGIFAAGDCCETYNRISKCATYSPLGDIANKQGWAAGENAAGGDIIYPGALGSWSFECFDLEVASTGLLSSQAERAGYEVFSNMVTHASRTHAQPGRKKIWVKLIADRKTHKLLGAQIAGEEGAAQRIQALAVALFKQMTVEELADVDLAYAPPFSPVIDPILIAARDATKRLAKP